METVTIEQQQAVRQAASLRYQQKYPSSNRPRFDPHVEQLREKKKHQRLLQDMRDAGFSPVESIDHPMPNLLQNHQKISRQENMLENNR